MRVLGELARAYGDGAIRVTPDQDLVFRWVNVCDLRQLYRRLAAAGLGLADGGTVADVTSCPGAESCRLAVTQSRGLGRLLEDQLRARPDLIAAADGARIKISGCPNGCGQHHVASIGFTGASIKVGEHTIPAYIPHVGGVFEGGEVKFGTRLKLRLPSKRVPDAIERWIGHYESNREDGEEWNDFAQRVGTGELEALVKDLSMPVDFELETMNQFIDWNRDVPFQVIRGEGECAV